MNRDERRQFIASSTWFEGAPADVLDQLAEAAVYRRFPANKFLWSLGEGNTEVFGVVSGRVRISVASAMGQEFAIVDREEGAWLGEPCLVNDLGRATDARVMTDAGILALPRQAVLNAADTWPLLYRNLFLNGVTNHRGLYEVLAGVLFLPLRARVAGRVLLLIEEHGEQVEEGVLIDIKLSQNDFARLAMGSRQRVNRIFRDWDKNGLVETRGEHLLIKDVEALEKELLPFEKPVTWVTGD